jgi:hypothetical protein
MTPTMRVLHRPAALAGLLLCGGVAAASRSDEGPPAGGARFFVAQRLAVRGAGGPSFARELGGLVEQELARVPGVTLAVPGVPAGRLPTGARLASLGLQGLVVEGHLALQMTRGEGAAELDCTLRTVLTALPSHAIKASMSVTFAVPGASRADDPAAVRLCLEASATRLGEDLATYLRTTR